jgi:zinc transport system ATP-binding protein
MNVLTCEKLSFKYENKMVFENMSFDLSKGDYLLVVGENGCGKTTLIKGILGLLKPVSGVISLNEINNTQIGYLPQQTNVQKDFPASVMEVVMSGMLNRKGFLSFYSKKDREHAKKNLSKLGILDLCNACYRELSGGQQQRVLLARALSAASKLLILDEPASDLDPKATNELYALIEDINKNQDMIVIMVSHDIKGSIGAANKVLHIDNSATFFGDKSDYLITKQGKAFVGGVEND